MLLVVLLVFLVVCCYWFDCYCVCCRFAGGCLGVLLTLYSLPGLSCWGWVVLEAFLGCFVVCLCVLLMGWCWCLLALFACFSA